MEQEPKIEQDPKKDAKKNLEHALRRLHGLVDEGGVRVSIDQLEFAIKEARQSISKAKDFLEK